MSENIAMVVSHGYAWREKEADEILREWNSMSAIKRLYWTLRGKSPGTRQELISKLQ